METVLKESFLVNICMGTIGIAVEIVVRYKLNCGAAVAMNIMFVQTLERE